MERTTKSAHPFLDMRLGGLRITLRHRPSRLLLWAGHFVAIATPVLSALHR